MNPEAASDGGHYTSRKPRAGSQQQWNRYDRGLNVNVPG